MKQREIFVSVIIPNYNHARYLDKRIRSILNQTYQDIEIIILDDKSTDDSRKVIEEYRKHPKVSHIIYNEENSGSTFKQWQKGIALAKGEFVWIAESDDYCETDLLISLIKQIQKHPTCVLAYALSQMVDQQDKFVGNRIRKHRNHFLKGKRFIQRYMCCENPVYNASSAIFSRKAALNISPLYMDYKGAGDRLFWIEIAEKGDVAVINRPLNYFRQHPNKVTPRKTLDGTNIMEDKRTFDYLLNGQYLDNRFRRYLVKGYYMYLIQSTQLSDESIRRKVLEVWNDGKQVCFMQRLLGRILVSLRYHGLYLYL